MFATYGRASNISQPIRNVVVPAMRCVPDTENTIGSHFVFYRITAEGIDVVRILHQRMDFEQHF
jgi:plasmid stabilization system protein ParE